MRKETNDKSLPLYKKAKKVGSPLLCIRLKMTSHCYSMKKVKMTSLCFTIKEQESLGRITDFCFKPLVSLN